MLIKFRKKDKILRKKYNKTNVYRNLFAPKLIKLTKHRVNLIKKSNPPMRGYIY
jgi:hypothetical protein